MILHGLEIKTKLMFCMIMHLLERNDGLLLCIFCCLEGNSKFILYSSMFMATGIQNSYIPITYRLNT
jgi:hypothetical protein